MKRIVHNTILRNTKKIVRKIAPSRIITYLSIKKIRSESEKHGLIVENDGVQYHIKKENDEIRISTKRTIYLNDIIENFDFYFSGVKPIKFGNTNTVDFSTPRWHWVTDCKERPLYIL